MDPTALPYIDALFKEYLLFRGFSDTLQAFSADLKADKVLGFQVDRLCSALFRRILPSLHCTALVELLQELDRHVWCRLDRALEDAVARLEVALVRLFLVTAVRAGRQDKVKELFELYGELLLSSARDGGASWQPWFTLPYVAKPEADPRFQVYFTPQWAALVESSFRNFLAQAFQQLPLPAVLRFDADRAKRAQLQRTVDSLKREVAELRAKLGLPAAAAAPSAAGGSGSGSNSGGGAVPQAAGAGPAGMAAALAADLGGGRLSGAVVGSAQRMLPSKQHAVPAVQLRPSAHQLTAAPPPGQQQQQQQQQQGQGQQQGQHMLLGRPSSGPQLQLYGRPSFEEGAVLSAASSSASLDGTGGVGSTESGLGPHSDAQQSAAASGEGPALPEGPTHSRTATLSHWNSDDAELLGGSQEVGARAASSSDGAEWDRARGGRGGASSDVRAASGSSTAAAEAAAPRGALMQRELLAGGHDAPITCCVFGPRGTHVASASSDGIVRIWAPRTLGPTHAGGGLGGGGLEGSGGPEGGGGGASAAAARCGAFSCGAPVTRLAWDRRGDKLMLAGTRGRGIKAWHLDTQRQVFQVDPESDAPVVTDLACSPSDPTFVCATSDASGRSAGRLTLWNMRAFKKQHTFPMPAGCAITSAAFAPDGHQLAAAAIDGKVRLFDASSRNQVMAWPVADAGTPFAVRFLGSSRLLVTLSADGYLKVWSTAVVRGPLAGLHVPLCCDAAAAGFVDFAAGGSSSGSGSGSLVRRASSSSGGGRHPQQQQQQWRPDLACNLDGSAFVAASVGAEVPVVRVFGGGEELRLDSGAPGHGAAVPAIDWHPDAGIVLTGSLDGSLILSDLLDVRQRESVTA